MIPPTMPRGRFQSNPDHFPTRGAQGQYALSLILRNNAKHFRAMEEMIGMIMIAKIVPAASIPMP